MCLNPQYIPNKGLSKGSYASEHGQLVYIPNNLKSNKALRQVPCGKCLECRRSYFNSIKQRGIVESMSSYLIFATLTCDDEHMHQLEVDGETYNYIPYSYIQNMFKRLRADADFMNDIGNREFRYLSVMEYGDTTHRPHFHLIIFVSKKSDDDVNSKYYIVNAFRRDMAKYYAVNIGTRKHPIYEKVFKQNDPYYDKFGKLRTNYYVELVEGKIDDTIFGKQEDEDLTNVKTIQYLLGYVNKPDKYLQKIHCKLEKYRDKDYELFKAIRNNLLCGIKYSKGFGSGFLTDGKKNYLQKISVRCSSNTYLYTEFEDNLPKEFSEFCEQYPDMSIELGEWIAEEHYSRYKSWTEFLNNISAEDYYYHILYVKYFNKEFSEKYKSYFNKVNNGSIGYIYSVNNRKYRYQAQKVRTGYADENTSIYKFLRKGVEEGLKAGVPYIAFTMVSDQKFTPLCKWYKDRVCTLDDTVRLYERLGVKNYDEYVELFSKEMSNYAAVEYESNLAIHSNDDIIQKPIKTQNIIKEDEIYSKLIWSCK